MPQPGTQALVLDQAPKKDVESAPPRGTVELRGTVLMATAKRGGFYLHTGERSTLVMLPENATCPDTGDLVEVEGESGSQEWGQRRRPVINATRILVTGKAKELPKAKAVPLEEATTLNHQDQWVSIGGQVVEWTRNESTLSLVLMTKERLTVVLVRLSPGAQVPQNLNGAVLRVTGVNAPYSTGSTTLAAPGIDQVEVLEPGVADLFSLPSVSLADILARKVPMGRLVRTQGVVVGMMAANRPILCSPKADQGAMIVDLRPVPALSPNSVNDPSAALPSLDEGELIEVVGAISTSSDVTGSGLSQCYVRHLGSAPVPPPRKVELHELMPVHDRDEWVSVEGVVTGWSWQNGRLWYSVVTSRSKRIFYARTPDGFVFPNDLHGAVLQFTGLWFGGSHLPRDDFFVVPAVKHVKVIQPGSRNPFAVPKKPLADIIRDPAPSGQRVRMRATVLGQTEGSVLHLRGGNETATASMQLPWNRAKGANAANVADGGPVPSVDAGDEVEIVASLIRSPVRPELEECDFVEAQVRILKKGKNATPSDAALDEVANGARTSDLVRVRGRLTALQQLPVSAGRWRTTMMIEAGGASFPVIHESTERTRFDTLKVDDELLATGLVKRATSTNPRHLRLLDASEVKSLGLARTIVRDRLLVGGSVVLGILLLMGAWIATLNRSVRLRTAELREAQTRLEKALEHERELGEMKSRFVSMVSHEFRTPLGVIMSAADVLTSYFDRLSAEKRNRHLLMIGRSTKNLAQLIDEVLLLGRVEEGRMNFTPVPIQLEKVCAALVDEVISASGGACPINFHAVTALDGAVSDESVLRHILNNVLSNAVKYSQPGTPVNFTAQRDGECVVFVITDQGIGIPKDDQARLFSSFTRGSNVGTRPGTGLGLVVVERCVQLHGGTIDLTSEPGKGTLVTIRLPVFSRDLS